MDEEITWLDMIESFIEDVYNQGFIDEFESDELLRFARWQYINSECNEGYLN